MNVLHFWPEDGVVECLAATPLVELQRHLAAGGQTLPYLPVPGLASVEDEVGELILRGYPHPFGGRYGGWSDWILGASMRMADGHVASSGSRVVKSVAGYDVHRMLVGSGGAFGRYESMILRTLPLALAPITPVIEGRAGVVQRVLPRDFAVGLDVLLSDSAAATLWWREGAAPVRTEDDRLWGPGITPEATSDEAWFLHRVSRALSGDRA